MKPLLTLSNHFYKQLFPCSCALCSMTTIRTFANTQTLCAYCESSLPYIDIACSKCSKPMHSNQTLCGECLSTNTPWQQCSAVFSYQEPISNFIHQLKYYDDKNILRFFTHNIKHSIVDDIMQLPDFLTFVPTHPKHFAKRGYNQSLRLAYSLSKLTKIPCIPLFNKTIATPQQTSLNKKARKQSIQGAFRLKEGMEPTIKNKHIVIIDDVVTTSATCTELAKILKSATAECIDIWCIART